MAAGGRVRMSGPQRREQLIGVAVTVFAERGYEATSIEELADRAGVSKPVVYEHFGGKETLYAVIVDREIAALTQRITSALAGGLPPRRAAESAADAFLAYIEEREDGFRILIRDTPVGSGRFASLIADVAAATTDLLAAEFEPRGYDRAMAPMYARMLVGAVALVGEWWLEVRTPGREEVAAHIVNLMWNGLGHLDPEPHARR